MIRRREFIKSLVVLTGAGLVPDGFPRGTPRSSTLRNPGKPAYYIPGYWPRRAFYRGMSVLSHPSFTKALPKGYNGPVTLLTRLSGQGESVRRAAFPIRGHGVFISPAGGPGFFASMNRNTMVSFSPDTLEMITLGRPQRREWIGGGHAVFTPDGRYLLVTERYPHLPFSGKPEDHFGMITVRDPETLRVIDSFSCYGIAPHEINVLEDSKHIAVANYGSTKPPKSRARNPLPFIVEPCVTVLDLQSGRLVYKVTAPRKVNEVRHVAAYNLRRVFAIQARLGTEQEGQEQMDGYPEVYERDRTADRGRTYLSAPVLRLDFSGTGAETPKALEIRASDPLLMRHGLSIIYEPTFDEVIATFPSSHCYMVFDGANGHIKHVVHTDQLGLRYPCGLALYPNGTHYAISGYWQNLFLFRRGSHELDRSAYRYHVFFGHSHIAIA